MNQGEQKIYYEGIVFGMNYTKKFYIEKLSSYFKNLFDDQIDMEMQLYKKCIENKKQPKEVNK